MSDFPPPFDPPSLTVPYPPPEVGEGSPWAPADAENRDRILDWWRAWWRRVFFPWLAAFIAGLNTWLSDVETYIIAHAISGYSMRVTSDQLNLTGTTDVSITVGEDVEFRPLVIGDLVVDQTLDSRFGVITVVIDDTHATVETLGSFRGATGNGWWVTSTTISASGTTDVTLPAIAGRAPQINDLVSDESSALRYGIVTALIDPTHATVTPLGVLRGLPGFGWWSTVTPITHSGTTAVVLSAGPDRFPQVNDLVVDQTASGAYGEITIVTDATHVTVAFVGLLQGPEGPTGPAGAGGVVSIVAGTDITVDDTDPAHPIVSSSGGGGGTVDSVVGGTSISVDSSDPANPIVSFDPAVGYIPLPSDPQISIIDMAGGWGFIDNTGGGHTRSVSAGWTGSKLVSIDGSNLAQVIVDNGIAWLINGDISDPAAPSVQVVAGGTFVSGPFSLGQYTVGSEPAPPVEGQMIYYTDVHKIAYFDGTSWVTL